MQNVVDGSCCLPGLLAGPGPDGPTLPATMGHPTVMNSVQTNGSPADQGPVKQKKSSRTNGYRAKATFQNIDQISRENGLVSV